MMAAREGHAAVAEALITGGANIEATANASQQCSVVSCLRRVCFSTSFRHNLSQYTELTRNNLMSVSALSISLLLQEGITPIIDAAGRGRLAVVSLLLGKGANVEAFDSVCGCACRCIPHRRTYNSSNVAHHDLLLLV